MYIKDAIRVDLIPFSRTTVRIEWRNRAIKREKIGARIKTSGSYWEKKELVEVRKWVRREKISIFSDEQSTESKLQSLPKLVLNNKLKPDSYQSICLL